MTALVTDARQRIPTLRRTRSFAVEARKGEARSSTRRNER